jgi:hypothetical protein
MAVLNQISGKPAAGQAADVRSGIRNSDKIAGLHGIEIACIVEILRQPEKIEVPRGISGTWPRPNPAPDCPRVGQSRNSRLTDILQSSLPCSRIQALRTATVGLAKGVQRSFPVFPGQRTCAPAPSATSSCRNAVISDNCQKGTVTAPEPLRSIWRRQQCLDLWPGQKAHEGATL